jgi:hypothetical protein
MKIFAVTLLVLVSTCLLGCPEDKPAAPEKPKDTSAAPAQPGSAAAPKGPAAPAAAPAEGGW